MRVRPFLTFLLALGLAPAALAQQPVPKPAAPAQPPGVKAELDIPYVEGGDKAQRLDLFVPEKPSDKPLPLIIWVHGGGWQGGNKSGARPKYLVAQGFAVASVEYRFSQVAKFPAQIQDCQAAVRFLRANAKKYNLDPDRFAAGGDSAGGHLVALMGTSGGKKAFPPIGGNDDVSDKVQCVIDFYGPANFNTVMAQAAADTKVKNVFAFNTPKDPYSNLIGVPLNSDKAKGDAVSPVHFVGKDSPPILILHGTADALVPYAQSIELADAYKAAGATAVLQTFPNAGHGGPVFGKPEVNNLIRAFLDKHLLGKDAKVEPVPAEAVTVPAVPAK
ncbi:MAG TPA: alpha/beta hydrolase [Humisphaera sp.]